MHAFCLACLEGQFGNKLPGDKASCPVCREEFQIPSEGVNGLKHHFIVQQLLELNSRMRESSCDTHKEKQVELYCHDCNQNICVKCMSVNHSGHNNVEISEVADNFRLRIDGDDEQILSGISSVREQSEQTKQIATEFHSKVEDTKKRVVATGDLVKRSVDDQINEVLMKLESVTSESDKQADSMQEAYQLVVESMENFHTRSRELLDKGRPSDITREAGELHDRATELLKIIDATAVKYRPPRVIFTPADVTQVKRLSLIGELTTTDQPGVSYLLHAYRIPVFVLFCSRRCEGISGVNG